MCEAEWVKFEQQLLWPEDATHLDFDVRYPSRERSSLTAADGEVRAHVILLAHMLL